MNNSKSNISLSSLAVALGSLPYINRGGCGQAALLMYKYLQAKGYKGVEIVFMYQKDIKIIYTVNKRAVECGDLLHPAGHVMLKWKNILFDCSKVCVLDFPLSELDSHYTHFVSQEQLEQSLYECPSNAFYGWNPAFEEHSGTYFTAVAEYVENEIINY